MAVTLTKDNFDEEVKEGVTLIDFWAEWCGPCKMVEPIVNELAEEWKGQVKVAKLDVDANTEVAQKYGVQSIPTMLLFKDGELVDRQVGALPKDAIVQFVEKNK